MVRRSNTRAIRARNRRILATSRVCWLCGHDGADAVDHKIPWTLRPDLADDPTNLAPAHHKVPCPTCGIKCNQVKAGLSPERYAAKMGRPQRIRFTGHPGLNN